MKHLILSVLCTLTFSQVFAGEGGDGTRGGGEVVNVNGHPELRDLVDTTVCRWQNGAAEYANTPALATTLDKIARVDWYIAATLKREIIYLDYCLTGNLVRVRTEDPWTERVVTTYAGPTAQVAIRLMDEVYINDRVRRLLPPDSQAMLLIHEAMHSFIDWNAQARNQKLRSMVRTLSDVATGRLTNLDELYLAIARNQADLPTTSASLRAYRSQVTFLLEGMEVKKAILATQTDPAAYLAKVATIPSDRLISYQRTLLVRDQVSYMVSEALSADDSSILEILMRSRSIARRVLAQVYEAANEEFHPRISEWLKNQMGLNQLVTLSLENLAAKKPEVRQGHIVTPGLELLSLDGTATTLSMELNTLAPQGFNKASAEMRAYFMLVRTSLEEGDMEKALDLTIRHPSYAKAFSIQTLVQEVRSLENVSAQEKDMVVRKARVLGTAFWRSLEAWMLVSVDRGTWETFQKQNINFGYEF